MKVKNLGSLLNDLKPLLRTYLEDSGTQFINKGSKEFFTCPNRKDHSNDDAEPSCNFYPDDEHWKCFVCQASGDILSASHYLEGRPLQGPGFINDNVLYLAQKYNIHYEMSEESQEEKEYNIAQQFLSKIVDLGNRYLLEKNPAEVLNYVKSKRNWNKAIHTHQLGFLPDAPPIKDFYESFKKQYPQILETKLALAYTSITNRLIYPVKNAYGLIVGISTRRLNKDATAKYQHHPIRVGAKQINLLYNLNNARNFSRIYLVEGASSIFTLVENRLNNVVAVLGSNFSSKHYEWLLKNDIKELVLCFDGDVAGQQATERTIKMLQDKSEIKIYVKSLPEELDPDEFIQKYGIDEFKNLPEVSIFKYQLSNYLKTEDKKYKESIFEMLISQPEALVREKMLKLMSKETKAKQTSILEDLRKYEQTNKMMHGVSIADYYEEEHILEKELDEFEAYRYKTEGLVGLDTKWPCYNQAFDGLRVGIHLVGGKWNVGKSVFLINMALNLLQDENNYVLYFSLDDPNKFVTLPRIISLLSGVDTLQILKPRESIINNETLTEDSKKDMLYKIDTATSFLRDNSHRFSLKDVNYGDSLEQILYNIKLCKQRALDMGNKNLVVFVDFLHMIHFKTSDELQRLIKITSDIKKASTLYEVPIVTTVTGTKTGFQEKTLKDENIKGPTEVQFQSVGILLIETDFYDNNGKMYFHDEIDGESRPILSVNCTKNKLGPFKGKIFYKFYNNALRIEEIDDEGQIQCRKGNFRRIT